MVSFGGSFKFLVLVEGLIPDPAFVAVVGALVAVVALVGAFLSKSVTGLLSIVKTESGLRNNPCLGLVLK